MYQGLERSQLVSMLLSTALCTIGLGLERSVLVVLFNVDSYTIYMQGLEMSLTIHGYVLFLWSLYWLMLPVGYCSANSWSKMTRPVLIFECFDSYYARVLKEGTWKEPLLSYYPCLVVLWVLAFSVWGLERRSWKELISYVLQLNWLGTQKNLSKWGLERDSFCMSSLPILIQRSWKSVLKGVDFVSFLSTWTATVLRSVSGPSMRNSSIDICNAEWDCWVLLL